MEELEKQKPNNGNLLLWPKLRNPSQNVMPSWSQPLNGKIRNCTKLSFQNLPSCPVFPAVQCSGGQVYQECGRTCGGSCAEGWSCDDGDSGTGFRTCVPGCQCPPGLLQDHQGQCVPITMCPCLQGDKMYQPGTVIQNNCNTWYVVTINLWLGFHNVFFKFGISNQFFLHIFFCVLVSKSGFTLYKQTIIE